MLKVVLPFILVLAFAACQAKELDAEIQSFWTDFRQAVLDSDKDKIAAMTHFPLGVTSLPQEA